MFADMQDAEDTVLSEMARKFEPWVRRMIAEAKYTGWITHDGEQAVGSAGLLILDWAPHFLDPHCDQRDTSSTSLSNRGTGAAALRRR